MNREDRNEYAKKWRRDNPEKVRSYSRKYREAHREVVLARYRNYHKTHKEKEHLSRIEYNKIHKEEKRLERIELRKEVLKHYGGKCACCGETTYEFLSIDHINGGGRKHREEIYRLICPWLKKNNYPDGFQVLCFNCNQAKGIYGICPHQKKGEPQ